MGLPPLRRNDRGAGLPTLFAVGRFEEFIELDPSWARSLAISTRRASTVAVSTSVVICNAMFVAAAALGNAVGPFPQVLGHTPIFPAQQAAPPLPHRYPRDEHQANMCNCRERRTRPVTLCDHVFIENKLVIGDRVTMKCGVKTWTGVRLADDVFVAPNVMFTNDWLSSVACWK